MPVVKPKLIAEATTENGVLGRDFEEHCGSHNSLSQHHNSGDSTKDSVETIGSF